MAKCDQCGGTGLAGPSFEEQEICIRCGGTGNEPQESINQTHKGYCLSRRMKDDGYPDSVVAVNNDDNEDCIFGKSILDVIEKINEKVEERQIQDSPNA